MGSRRIGGKPFSSVISYAKGYGLLQRKRKCKSGDGYSSTKPLRLRGDFRIVFTLEGKELDCGLRYSHDEPTGGGAIYFPTIL
jgi:hypothetical protein